MPTYQSRVDEFLRQKNLAVAGVSSKTEAVGNIIYRKLRDNGYHVYAINPNAREVEGHKSYPNLQSIEGPVDGVIIATHPREAERIVHDCADKGISRVWLHQSFGQGSVSKEAIAWCETHDIEIIPTGCPMMFCGKVDLAHRCMRWILKKTGKLPE